MSPPTLEIEGTADETSAVPWSDPWSLYGTIASVAPTQPGVPPSVPIISTNTEKTWSMFLTGNANARRSIVAFYRNLLSTLQEGFLVLEQPQVTESGAPGWSRHRWGARRYDYGQSSSIPEFMISIALNDFEQRQGGVQALPAESYAAAIDAEGVHFNTPATRNVIQDDQFKSKAITYIGDLICARETQDIERIERQLYNHVSGHEDILFDIMQDQSNLINVRAMAARLYIAKVGSPTAPLAPKVQDILPHKSPLIRLGLVLGFADATNWDIVRLFTEDPHPTVAEEARELLSEVILEACS